jgi:quinol-cytochrome oxidoreductase complex cytochrome b subunit
MNGRLSKGSFSALLLHLHPPTIPESSAKIGFTWCLGGLAALMFLIETVTGVLLLLHYIPTAGGAYTSMQDIIHVIPYGFFLRNIHYWAGQIMVGLVGLHMVRVFWTGSFAPPRQFNWIIGLMLLVGTILIDFTGYLLVWDTRSLWAWTIARNLCGTVPVIGAATGSLLFGPEHASDAVLIRIYVWHVVLLPAIMVVFASWHFWRIRKDGGISGPL